MNKEEFYREFGDYLGVPSDIVISEIYEEVYYSEGCPTCGGDYEFTVFIIGKYPDGNDFTKSYYGRLADFIRSL